MNQQNNGKADKKTSLLTDLPWAGEQAEQPTGQSGPLSNNLREAATSFEI